MLNAIPMTIAYQSEMKTYEDQGVTFLEDITQRYYNLTMIVEVNLALNNIVIFCLAVDEDLTTVMSQEVQLVIFNNLSKYYRILNGLGNLCHNNYYSLSASTPHPIIKK